MAIRERAEACSYREFHPKVRREGERRQGSCEFSIVICWVAIGSGRVVAQVSGAQEDGEW